MKLDPKELKLRELKELEQTFGMTLDKIMETSTADGMAGIAWLIERRTNPGFTLDDAYDLELGDFDEGVTGVGEALGVNNGESPQSLLAPGP